ncbi:hypothetical protein NYE24_02860 [Paenibacillus sp. FSL H7-0350]|uniref:hypothetical protein n=1 Tax=Paenibacillus sp. FSL H7-0350 TaxID=2975345 RepID=UPI0031588E2A
MWKTEFIGGCEGAWAECMRKTEYIGGCEGAWAECMRKTEYIGGCEGAWAECMRKTEYIRKLLLLRGHKLAKSSESGAEVHLNSPDAPKSGK